jgi:uncharacterized protein YbcI
VRQGESVRSRSIDAEAPAAIAERRSMLVDISNAVVRIHKHFYGKGPTNARAHVSRDLVTVVLEGAFTRAEQTLHDSGHGAAVAQSRTVMRDIIEDEMTRVIESIIGCRVRSFMSATDLDNGLATEIFVLHPKVPHPATTTSPGAPRTRENVVRAYETRSGP